MNKKSIIQGTKVTCPRCKTEHDLLQYVKLMEIPEYSHETVPVYKCPSCKWIFSIAGEMDHQIYEELYREMQETLAKALERIAK